jgi:glycosyltransferase involved in cell wall biosynthesis
VYNSTDINKYKFCEKKEDYMFFVGNSTKTKGPDLAIKVARRVKGKLIMATKVDDKYRNFFNSAIKPYADGKNMILHEKISFEKKLDLYQHAKCLLFPIRWEEPFGLVMIEAMACGTPVVAMNRGSVPEVIKHGETGFVADNYGEFVEYVKRVDEIDPRKCRKWVEKNFTIGKMTDGYLKVYKKLLKG